MVSFRLGLRKRKCKLGSFFFLLVSHSFEFLTYRLPPLSPSRDPDPDLYLSPTIPGVRELQGVYVLRCYRPSLLSQYLDTTPVCGQGWVGVGTRSTRFLTVGDDPWTLPTPHSRVRPLHPPTSLSFLALLCPPFPGSGRGTRRDRHFHGTSGPWVG